jgi:tetratricopeptide (TPR) repeat protein
MAIKLKAKIILTMSYLFLFAMALNLITVVLPTLHKYRKTKAVKQKGVYRIMCVGEDTTRGQFPVFLEEVLNQSDLGIKFSVIDKGTIAASTTAILEHISADVDEYQPDMVVAMMGINDTEESYAHYNEIPLEIDRDDVSTYLNLERFYLEREKFSQAEGAFKKFIQLHPEEYYAYIGLAWCCRDKGKFSQAEDAYKKAIAIDPINIRGHIELGHFYLDKADFLLAEEAYKKAIAIDSGNASVYSGLGALYREQGKLYLSEAAYKKVIELNPEEYNAFMCLGQLYWDQSKIALAENVFRELIKMHPENARAYFELGRLYHAEGESLQAEAIFMKLIHTHPENAYAYFELGRLYHAQGKYAQAEVVFKKAIEVNHDEYFAAYEAISLLYKEMGNPRLTKEYEMENGSRLWRYGYSAINNYYKLKKILDKSKIRFVCVQYPMLNIKLLREIFKGNEKGVVFVDNGKVFKEAIKKGGSYDYFIDMFAVCFGHCTKKGNRLLAENIANVILREEFY